MCNGYPANSHSEINNALDGAAQSKDNSIDLIIFIRWSHLCYSSIIMSYQQIRSANHHREMNQLRKPHTQYTASPPMPSPWSQQHQRSNLDPSLGLQNFSMREQQRMNPQVQQLQRELNKRHLYSESYSSGRPSFDNTYCQPTSSFPNVCQTLSRPDNRGYPDQSIRNLHSSFMPARFTYPPAESNEAETNQLRDKKFRGFDDQRLNDSLSCHPARHHYEETHSVPQDNTKRMKTEYGYFPASQQFPPPLPPPQYPNIESPVDNFAMSSSIRTVKSHKRAHSDDQGLSAVVSEEKTVDESSVNSSTNDHPHLLALPEDRSHLTALHCFIRSDCVYIFCAEAHEVDGECDSINVSSLLLMYQSNFLFKC